MSVSQAEINTYSMTDIMGDTRDETKVSKLRKDNSEYTSAFQKANISGKFMGHMMAAGVRGYLNIGPTKSWDDAIPSLIGISIQAKKLQDRGIRLDIALGAIMPLGG